MNEVNKPFEVGDIIHIANNYRIITKCYDSNTFCVCEFELFGLNISRLDVFKINRNYYKNVSGNIYKFSF